MQLTRFDRWLREKFVYEIHIQTLRPPDSLPKGVRAVATADIPGKRYKHLFVTSSSKAADTMFLQLKQNSQMYTTEVVDRKAWYVPFLAPKDRSVSWWLFSTLIVCIGVCAALIFIKDLVEQPTFRKNFKDALELLKK